MYYVNFYACGGSGKRGIRKEERAEGGRERESERERERERETDR